MRAGMAHEGGAVGRAIEQDMVSKVAGTESGAWEKCLHNQVVSSAKNLRDYTFQTHERQRYLNIACSMILITICKAHADYRANKSVSRQVGEIV